MPARHYAFVAVIALCIIPSLSRAQTRNDATADDFWERFEKRLNGFVTSVTTDLLSEQEAVDSTSHDSLRRTTGGIPTITYEGNTSVPAGDTVRADIRVRNGDLTVYGRIEGDVLAERGSVIVRDRGTITGSVTILDGDISRDDGTTVPGPIETIRPFSRSERNDYAPFLRRAVIRPLPWMNETVAVRDAIVKYNRVEGLFIGLASPKRYYWRGDEAFAPYGFVGYGFAEHRWRGTLGIPRQVAIGSPGKNQLLEFGAEAYSLTDSKDQWRIGAGENTAAAFFIHEDFRDYFGREGFSLHSAYYRSGKNLFVEGSLRFLADRYESLSGRTDWSLFGGGKTFRPNPRIDDGIMRSVVVLAGFSTATGSFHGPDGWNVHASAEFADRHTFGGEFTFNQYLADIRRYLPIGEYDNFNVRLRVGTAHGFLPGQKSYDLGGLGSIPAYPFKSAPGDTLGGNRMILLNAEYSVNGDFLGDLDFWPSFIMRHVNFLFLADAGLVRSVSHDASFAGGFGGIHWEEFGTDFGVGLANRSGSFRIGVVWRTDRSEPARFLLRLERPF